MAPFPAIARRIRGRLGATAFVPVFCSEGWVAGAGRASGTAATSLAGVSGTSSGGVGDGSTATTPEGLTAGVGDKGAGVFSITTVSEGRGWGVGGGKRFFTLAAATACTMPSFQMPSVERSFPEAANDRNWAGE